MASYLAQQGQQDEALAATREAVDLWRRLAQVNPAEHEPDLAWSLGNLASYLAQQGQQDEALAATREAVDLWRRLAQVNPAEHELYLAGSLTVFAQLRTAGGIQLGDALTAAQESIDIYRRLAAQSPDVFADALRNVIESAVEILDGMDRTAEAAAIRPVAEDLAARTWPELKVEPIELAIRQAIDHADREGSVREAVRAASIYVFGRPAGDTPPPGHGTESDLLQFIIDDAAGAELVILPAFTNASTMRDALLRNADWQTLSVLKVNGGVLLENIDDNVNLVINPWTELEFRFPARRAHAAPRAPRLWRRLRPRRGF